VFVISVVADSDALKQQSRKLPKTLIYNFSTLAFIMVDVFSDSSFRAASLRE
jgi:hypothetical protein